MSKHKILKAVDFSQLDSDHVRRLLKELYDDGKGEKREFQFGKTEDRRQKDRRQQDLAVPLDTRSSSSRRKSTGRRVQDEHDESHYRVGIDYYV